MKSVFEKETPRPTPMGTGTPQKSVLLLRSSPDWHRLGAVDCANQDSPLQVLIFKELAMGVECQAERTGRRLNFSSPESGIGMAI